MAETQSNQEGSYKKIQNYIFNFNDLLGKGNFSKVYKAHNEVTSILMIICRRNRGDKNSRAQQPQKQKIIITALFWDINPKKTEPSERDEVLLSLHQQPKLLHNNLTLQLGWSLNKIKE